MVKLFATNKYRLLIAIILSIATTIVLVLFINMSTKLQKQVMNKKYELASLQAELDALDKLMADKVEYEDEIEVIVESIPSSYAEVAYFVEEIERVATQSSIVIDTDIEKLSKDEKNGLESVGFEVESRGNFISYADMMGLIANLPFHTKVDSMKVEGQGPNVISLMNFRFYIWGDQE